MISIVSERSVYGIPGKERGAGGKQTRRARLKPWRQGAATSLSAHLDSGASSRNLWRRVFAIVDRDQCLEAAPPHAVVL